MWTVTSKNWNDGSMDLRRIVKKHDHLMDATRYLVRSGMKRARPLVNEHETTDDEDVLGRGAGHDGWAV